MQVAGMQTTAVGFVKQAKDIFTQHNCKSPDGNAEVLGLVSSNFPFAMCDHI